MNVLTGATPMVEIVKNKKVIHKSRNLRGLLDYARKCPVQTVDVMKYDGGANVYVIFDNGATCDTRFADYSVALDFFKARRSWSMKHSVIDAAWWHLFDARG